MAGNGKSGTPGITQRGPDLQELTQDTDPIIGVDRAPTLGNGGPAEKPSFQETSAELIEDATNIDGRIGQLPEEARLSAMHGITARRSLRPSLFPVITVTLPRKNLGAMTEALKGLALPCNTSFLGNTDDPFVTVTYMVPSPREAKHGPINAYHILDKAKKGHIPAQITVAERPITMLGTQNIPLTTLTSAGQTLETEDFTEAKARYQSGDELEKLDLPITAGENSPTNFEVTPLASRESLHFARKLETEIPREGDCVFLMVDLSFIDNLQSPITDPGVNKLIGELALLSKPEFHVNYNNGYLTIIGTEERAGSSLTAMALRLWRVATNSTILLGNGEVEHQNGNSFSIKGFPTRELMTGTKELSGGMYLTEGFKNRMTDPKQRDASLCHIETKTSGLNGVHKLTDYQPRVTLRVGGPDRVVGAETPFEAIREGVTDEKTRLLLVAGTAGMGKSRLIEAALQELPNPDQTVITSIDPAGKNTHGFGLMTVAEQIAFKLREKPVHDLPREATGLLDYNRKTLKEKLQDAQEKPRNLVETCLAALKYLNKGKTVFVLDDIHHADRSSMTHLRELAERYLEDTDGKVIMAMRPEELDQSETIKDLGKRVLQKEQDLDSVKRVGVDGLDFTTNHDLARDFIFYSLPERLREGKTLGLFYEEMAKIAGNSPFVMKTLIDEILEDPANNLVISDNAINLSREMLERMKKIKSGDLTTYYRQRLERLEHYQGLDDSPEKSEQLGAKARQFLECIALMGGRVTTDQSRLIAGVILDIEPTSPEFLKIKKHLLKGKYILDTQLSGKASSGATKQGISDSTHLELQHETIGEIVVASIRDKSLKLKLAFNLYLLFKDDTDIHHDIKFTLAHNIATNDPAPGPNEPFWQEYADICDKSLSDATAKNNIGKVFSISATMTGKDTPSAKVLKTPIAKAIEALQTGQQIDAKMAKVAVDTLLKLAENAIFIHRISSAEDAITELEKISTARPDLVPAKRVNLLRFEMLYVTPTRQAALDMRSFYYDKLEKDAGVTPMERALAKVKLAYRTRILPPTEEYPRLDPLQVYNEHLSDLHAGNREYIQDPQNTSRMPHPDYVEALRLAHTRVPYELLRNQIRIQGEFQAKFNDGRAEYSATVIDDDVVMQPGALNRAQKATLATIERSIEDLIEIRQNHPLAFRPRSEISLLETQASILALNGRFDEAVTKLAEAYRQAMQMELYADAARAAKLEGDIQVLSSITTTDQGITKKAHSPNPDKLIKAVKIYGEQGIAALTNNTDVGHYPAALRIQRIRAIGLLCASHERQIEQTHAKPAIPYQEIEKARLTELLEDHITTALSDYRFLNQNYANFGRDTQGEEEFMYYTLGYMGHILEAAQQLGIDIEAIEIKNINPDTHETTTQPVGNVFDSEQYPYSAEEKVRLFDRFRQHITDNRFGEVTTKVAGANKFAQAVERAKAA